MITGIGILCLIITNSYSQEAEQHHNHKQRHEEMVKRLNLTPDQSQSMKAIKNKYKPQLIELHESSLSKEERKTKRKEIKKIMDSEVQAVLNPEQYKEYLAFIEECKAEHKAKRAENAERLNLTSEQEAQMKSIKTKYRPELVKLKESDLPKSEKKAKRKEITGKMDSEVKTVLNDEQYKEYIKIKAERKEERKKQ